jgi:CarD family transcriptional regulator
MTRTKSKKATKSKAKKAGPASSTKSTRKRVAKEASSSGARNRVGKRKPASSVRVARKAIRGKIKSDISKLSKRKRRSSIGGTAVRARGAAKRPVKAARRKTAASKSLNKTIRSASVAKARSIERAISKEVEAKLRSKSKNGRNGPESATPAHEAATPSAVERPGFAEASLPFESIEFATPPKSAASPVKVQKTAAPEEAPSSAKSVKAAGQRHGFKLNEFVVYPAHGVGQIVSIEEQEVAGFKLELFVINFSKDKLTLRVPTSKVSGVGMRKISDPDTARRSLEILTGRARVKRTMWSRRAQEYETKINSGDINAIAEVVRDLYRSEAQPEQSYSERQLYEAALDRMVREIAVVQKSNEIDALKMVEAQLQKGQSRASKSGGAQSLAGEIEQAA